MPCLLRSFFGCVVDGFFDNDSDKFLIGVNRLGVSVSCQGHLFFHRMRECVVVLFFNGEFDPGSGRTLAACLTHASRAERPFRGYSSGERVSNT